MKSNITDIDMLWMAQTEKAVCLAEHETAEPVWLPKSRIEIDMEGRAEIRGTRCVVTLPIQLAIEKGLC